MKSNATWSFLWIDLAIYWYLTWKPYEPYTCSSQMCFEFDFLWKCEKSVDNFWEVVKSWDSWQSRDTWQACRIKSLTPLGGHMTIKFPPLGKKGVKWYLTWKSYEPYTCSSQMCFEFDFLWKCEKSVDNFWEVVKSWDSWQSRDTWQACRIKSLTPLGGHMTIKFPPLGKKGVKWWNALSISGRGGEHTFKYNAAISLQKDYIPLNNLVSKISHNSQLSFSFSDPLFCT